MSLQFYAVKMLAIASIAIIYFIVLSAVSYGMSHMFPKKEESMMETSIIFFGQIALFTVAFYAVRTQLKHFPKVFEGMAGFKSDLLKERDGSVLSGLALLMFSDSFVQRGLKIKEFLALQMK